MLWACSACWVWGATARFGAGCLSGGGPWSAPGATVWPGRGKWMRRIGAGNGPASEAGGAAGKALVWLAAQVDGAKIGRIRRARSANASGSVLEQGVGRCGEPGSQVLSDGGEGLGRVGGPRLSARARPGAGHRGRESSAARPSRGGAPATLAWGHPSRSGRPLPLGLLPGRVHVSVQPAHLPRSRSVVLSADRAGGRRWPDPLQGSHWRNTAPRNWVGGK